MTGKQIFLVVFVLAVAILALTPNTVFAQMAGTGIVLGTVTDPSGAVVAGATVTLTDTSTNEVRTATTNDAGRYNFPNVVPGEYNLTISKEGFRQVKIVNQKVVVGESRTVDIKMEIGAATQVIEVVATNTELQTMNATIGTTVTGVALESLPSLGRDASTFVTLQPGAAPDGSVAGANQDQNSYQLDGGNNSSDMDGTMNTYTPGFAGDPSGGLVNSYVTVTGVSGAPGGGGPSGVMPTPIDSIEEFKVGTTNQTADFNSSAGAQVAMVTRRGTSTWHGTAYEYYLDNNWNANNFDNNANGVPIPSYHYNRFGAAAGGPIIPKSFLGGKWYFFGNYEGFRFPNAQTVTKTTPSDGMRLGLLQFGGTVYNLNPGPVTYPSSSPAIGVLVPGTTYAGSGTTLDPRGLGVSPAIQALWKYMPESNSPSCGGLSRCDNLNVLKFTHNMPVRWSDNFAVARLDHDFGSKWHFYSTYRYYHMQRDTNNQVDIGGFFRGDTLGVPAPVSNRPQVPWYLTAAMTTNITNNVTNEFHYSFLRNYWARASQGEPPQLQGMGGAIEPFGETRGSVLAPYNLNTQDVRTRFWDGKDNMIRDDVSWIKGTHFFQFGGTYQRNYDYHQRTDNGGGINYMTVYWTGAGVTGASGVDMTGYIPAAISAAKLDSTWTKDYAIVLGMLGATQIAYTRTGNNLTLNPPHTPAFDQSTIPYYNLYFSDSWRMKPTFTLTYGLGWTLEMPPTEAQGKQITLVDQNDKPVSTEDYLNARKNAALAGQVYNPILGFTLNGNVAGHPKYPYNPYYKSFSPRIAAAWSPNFDSGLLGALFGRNKSVVRGGYGILYGRLNGVDLVLVPLLGTGLIQAVQCVSPVMNDPTCVKSGASTPLNAFRIGPDGLVAPLPAASQSLPQPDFPGVNDIAAGAGEGLDPNFRPSVSQQYNFTIQRQFSSRFSVEFGYIGRHFTHEYQPININAVPYMMTKGGQTFAKAYGQMVWQYCGGAQGLAGGNCAGNLAAVTPQPFFEAALNPSYCAGFASCTQAVAATEGNNGTGNIQANNVWSLYSDLDSGAFNFPRSMMNTPIPGSPFGSAGQATSGIGMNASLGYGNYNAGFVSVKMANWKGLTLQSNFTYGKALGTGSEVQATSQFTVPDAYNLQSAYGLQPWDRKFMFNAWAVYELPFYKSQHGFVGHLAGGWTLSPILVIGSGLPLEVSPSDAFANEVFGGGQSWGEGEGANFAALQNAINMCGNTFGSSRHNNPVGGNSVYGSAGYGPSMFQDPAAAYNCFRNPILGIDGSAGGGAGTLRGMAFWNVDFSVKKNIKVTERVSTEFTVVFSNLFNHNQLSDPYLIVGDQADWGALGGYTAVYNGLSAQANSPRAMEFGLRIRF